MHSAPAAGEVKEDQKETKKKEKKEEERDRKKKESKWAIGEGVDDSQLQTTGSDWE